MNTKDAHERQVFLEFAGAARLALDKETVENRSPPEPDIRCKIAGEIVYFELGRLLDKGMQDLKLRLLKGKRGKTVSTSDGDVRLPEREMLSQKLGKSYETAGAPVDLLLYYDNENLKVGDVPVFEDPEFKRHADCVMRPLMNERPGVFERVWVFERHRPSVLWCYPEGRAG